MSGGRRSETLNLTTALECPPRTGRGGGEPEGGSPRVGERERRSPAGSGPVTAAGLGSAGSDSEQQLLDLRGARGVRGQTNEQR